MKYNHKLELGKSGEEIAANFLVENRFQIYKRNYHSAFGEIDIIAIKNQTIHFVEVKTRSRNYESALSSISTSKQLKLIKTANMFLTKHLEFQDYYTQFDVIAIYVSNNSFSLRHLKDAFRNKL